MKIENTENTPYIHLSPEESKFEIIGDSFSDQADKIYSDILKWIDSEFPKLQSKINCVFYFSVLNSVTYKNILSILKSFEEYIKKGKEISVDWYYDKGDDDNFDLAKDISELFEVPFNIIEKHNNDEI